MVETLDVTVKVTKSSYALGQGLRQFIAHTRKALADGWQPGQDLPVILAAAYTDLITHITDAGKISEEAVLSEEFLSALVLCAKNIAFDLTKPVA